MFCVATVTLKFSPAQFSATATVARPDRSSAHELGLTSTHPQWDRRPRRGIKLAYTYGTNAQDRLSWPRSYSQLPDPSVMLLQSHAQPVQAPERYIRETTRVSSEYHL